MLVSEKVLKEISKAQLHVMPVCLRNAVVTKDTVNVLPAFPNTAGHD